MDSTANVALPELKFCKIKIPRQFQTNADYRNTPLKAQAAQALAVR